MGHIEQDTMVQKSTIKICPERIRFLILSPWLSAFILIQKHTDRLSLLIYTKQLLRLRRGELLRLFPPYQCLYRCKTSNKPAMARSLELPELTLCGASPFG